MCIRDRLGLFTVPAGSAAAGRIGEARKAHLREAHAPLADRGGVDLQLRGDGIGAQPVRSQEDDAAAEGEALLGPRAADVLLQHAALLGAEADRCGSVGHAFSLTGWRACPARIARYADFYN